MSRALVEVAEALEGSWQSGLRSLVRRRGAVGTSFAILLAGLVVLQAIAVLALSEATALRALQVRSPVIIDVLTEATDSQIQSFRDALLHLPFVEGVVHVTREQAYERERAQHPDFIAALENAKQGNPFVDTLVVSPRHLHDYAKLASFLGRTELRSVVDPRALPRVLKREGQVKTLALLHRWGQRLLWFLLLCCLCLLFLLMVQVLQLRLQGERQRVLLQSVVGAPLSAITRPFFVEVIVLLGCALALATLLVGGGTLLLPRLLSAELQEGLALFFADLRPQILSVGVVLTLLEFLALALLGALATRLVLCNVTRPLLLSGAPSR